MYLVTKARQFLRWDELPPPLLYFVQLSLMLSLVSWEGIGLARLLYLPDPYRSTYFYKDFATDFTAFRDRFALFHQPAFYTAPGQPFTYPASLAVVYHILFTAWGRHSHAEAVIAIVALVIALGALALFYRALCSHGLASVPAALLCIVTFITSYPLAYEIQRGNVESIVWLTMLLAFWAFREDRFYVAAAFIGIAIAFKFYPIILLGLFLHPKRYRAIPVALLVTVLVTLLSDLWLGPSIRVAQMESARGMTAFVQIYVVHYLALGQDHSLFALFKTLCVKFNPRLHRDLKLYFVLAGAAASALYLFRIWRLPLINQICILMIFSIVLPPVSFDYTLLHVYTCWGIFSLYVLDNYRLGRLVPMARQVMTWFAIAVAPNSYIFLRNYAGLVHCVGLLALLYLFLRYPFAEPTDVGFTTVTSVSPVPASSAVPA